MSLKEPRKRLGSEQKSFYIKMLMRTVLSVVLVSVTLRDGMKATGMVLYMIMALNKLVIEQVFVLVQDINLGRNLLKVRLLISNNCKIERLSFWDLNLIKLNLIK